ncbi:MAG: hypothetical protein E7K04_02875 [Helicobacter sp.]|nr:hypothetical protein [Helicobacter sp.]
MKKIALALISQIIFVFAAQGEISADLKFATPPKTPQSDIDLEILLAQDALSNGNFDDAKVRFLKLYETSKDPMFAQYLALIDASVGNLDGAFNYAKIYVASKGYKKNIAISKILVDGYIKENNLKRAIELLLEIKKEENNPLTDEILGELYLNTNQPDLALKALMRYYNYSKNANTLVKIIDILERKNDQKALVQIVLEHIKFDQCKTKSFCLYANEILKDAKKLEIFTNEIKAIYDKNKSDFITILYGDVLINQLKFKEAEAIAKAAKKETKYILLINIAKAKDDTKEAIKLAQEAYEATKQIGFINEKISLQYSSIRQEITKENIAQISKDLERALSKAPEKSDEKAYLYNFLGFVLIDNDVDVKKGIDLIKKALEIKPNQVEYIDSLAWGFYKQNNCSAAQSTFAKIPKRDVEQNEELKKHFDSIAKCKN